MQEGSDTFRGLEDVADREDSQETNPLFNFPKVKNVAEFKFAVENFRVYEWEGLEFLKFPRRPFIFPGTDLVCFAQRRGGMSTVYLAHPQGNEDPSNWRAIKVLNKARDPKRSEEVRHRFHREAHVLRDAAQENPYWAKVVADNTGAEDGKSAGADERSGAPLNYVMEFLYPGISLNDYQNSPVGRYRLDHLKDAQLAAAFLLQIAVALVPLHEKGMVLRDLKPDNVVIVLPTKEKGFVRLIDTGIVTGKRMRQLTPPNYCLGTPCYMSPESYFVADTERSNSEHLSPACDMYSLGCIAHELLIGYEVYSHEFKTPDGMIGSLWFKIRMKLRNLFPGLIAREVAERREDLMWQHTDDPVPVEKLIKMHPRLGALTAQLLAKDPKKRPDVWEVIRVLQAEVKNSRYKEWVGQDALKEFAPPSSG